MKMKNQKAFTLLELVFVILILGIISFFALPEFVGISDDAHTTKLEAFVGTLNRTVGASMWSSLQRTEPQQEGKLAGSMGYSQIGEGKQVEHIPTEFKDLGTPAVISLASCMLSSNTVPRKGESIGGLTAGKVAGTALVGTTTYALGCIDGSMSGSPKFYLYDEVAGVVVY